jgi:hypothetical protein
MTTLNRAPPIEWDSYVEFTNARALEIRDLAHSLHISTVCR